MARKPMITRTITTTRANVLCMDIVRCEAENKVIDLPRTFADSKKLLDACKAVIDTAELKAVAIVDQTVVEKLYGMSEQDFMAHSVELDPVTRKPLDTTDTTDATDASDNGAEE